MMENTNSVCIPKPSVGLIWLERHLETTKLVKEVNVLFIGDSMIEYMLYTKTWKDKIAPLNCENFGIAGECIQNLLYRLENGALDQIKAKVIVYMIGTNNVSRQSSNVDDIAAGIFKVAQVMRLKQPEALVVSLSIPPKGRERNFTRDLLGTINSQVETRIKQHGDEKIQHLCCHDGFLNPKDGTLYSKDYTDWLHFSDDGYEKFCEPLIHFLNSVL